MRDSPDLGDVQLHASRRCRCASGELLRPSPPSFAPIRERDNGGLVRDRAPHEDQRVRETYQQVWRQIPEYDRQALRAFWSRDVLAPQPRPSITVGDYEVTQWCPPVRGGAALYLPWKWFADPAPTAVIGMAVALAICHRLSSSAHWSLVARCDSAIEQWSAAHPDATAAELHVAVLACWAEILPLQAAAVLERVRHWGFALTNLADILPAGSPPDLLEGDAQDVVEPPQ